MQVDKANRSASEETRQQADSLLAFITSIAKAFLTELGFESANHALQIFGGHGYIAEWGSVTMKIGMKSMENRDEVGAASVDYLMYSGYVALAYLWASMAKTAQSKLAQSKDEAAFYEAKLTTARFYYQRLLPRTRSLVETMQSGADNLMTLDEASFAF